jgi:hypothetical protein
MGWLWSSSSEDATTSTDTNSKNTTRKLDLSLSTEQQSRIFGQPPQSPPTSKPSPSQQEDKDMAAFLSSFTTADETITQRTAAKTAQIAQTGHERIRPDGTLDISPSSLYPRTMSCRQAFDQAFYCQSLGGKFNDIYRYGHLQSCSEQWGAFWFCMRTRTNGKETREAQIQEYYREREERRRKEWGSSESVWEMRTVPVERAFWRDPDKEEAEEVVKE